MMTFHLHQISLKHCVIPVMTIHDFAWFADKRFHVLKGSVQLPESGREVSNMGNVY